jgi:hypothetical protein
MRRLFYAVLLAVSCAGHVYVRPYTPATRADTVAVRADSVAWAADLRAKRAQQAGVNLAVYFCVTLAMTGLLAAAGAR